VYAEAQGKPRWGDKTPSYLLHMPLLTRAFPGARFVHIVRDGREVATSWRETWWGPDDVLLTAHQWRRMLARSAADARRLPPGSLLEVRYAALVEEPMPQLARILDFLGEDMQDDLLAYAERSAADLPGTPREHRHLLEPPRSQIRDWRASCTPAEQARVEALVAPTMRRLGLGGHLRSTPWRRLDAELHLLPVRGRKWLGWVVRALRR
jgi:hypothetical protein